MSGGIPYPTLITELIAIAGLSNLGQEVLQPKRGGNGSAGSSRGVGGGAGSSQ